MWIIYWPRVALKGPKAQVGFPDADEFCQQLQLDFLHFQAEEMRRKHWKSVIWDVEGPVAGKPLVLKYWK